MSNGPCQSYTCQTHYVGKQICCDSRDRTMTALRAHAATDCEEKCKRAEDVANFWKWFKWVLLGYGIACLIVLVVGWVRGNALVVLNTPPAKELRPALIAFLCVMVFGAVVSPIGFIGAIVCICLSYGPKFTKVAGGGALSELTSYGSQLSSLSSL